MATELFHVDTQTDRGSDMPNLAVVFRHLANAPTIVFLGFREYTRLFNNFRQTIALYLELYKDGERVFYAQNAALVVLINWYLNIQSGKSMELKFPIIQAISKSLELVFPGNAAPFNLKVISVG